MSELTTDGQDALAVPDPDIVFRRLPEGQGRPGEVGVDLLLEGRPIYQGGRDHTSHRLVYYGLSEKRAVILLALISASLGATSLGYTVLPNSRLTPGEAFSGVGPSSFCVSGYTTRVRNVTQSERYQVFAEYHIPYAQHTAYEVDHLIPLELGGSNSIRNLFAEAALPKPGFHQKDVLENKLHSLVCSGSLKIRRAQKAIASN